MQRVMTASPSVKRDREGGALARLMANGVLIRALLACGIAQVTLYVAMDSIAASLYDGYSQKTQTISELSAFGAPTRGFWIVGGVVWNVLMFAFALGALAVAGTGARRSLGVASGLLLVYALVNPLWFVAPMHQREVLAAGGGDWHDTMHLTMGGVTVVLGLLIIGFGAASYGWRFRAFSASVVVAMMVGGLLTSIAAPGVNDDGSTPWIGVTERISVFGMMLWFTAFAAMLLRTRLATAGPD